MQSFFVSGDFSKTILGIIDLSQVPVSPAIIIWDLPRFPVNDDKAASQDMDSELVAYKSHDG